MKNLDIDEEFDIPCEIDRDELTDEVIRFYNIEFPDDMEFDEINEKVGQIIDEHIENYTHTNGKVYVGDWDVFENDLRRKVIRKLCADN